MDTVILRTESDPARADAVLGALEAHCRAAGLDAQETYRLTCAVVEGFNNIVEHAYHGRPGRPVELHWNRSGAHITVELRDWGETLTDLPEKTLPATEAEHGRGWFIMRQWLDAVEYECVDGCNRLRLIRHLPR
jgi:serine/threonine-protein kinase RsbW